MKDSITRLEAIFNTAKELPTSEQREVYLRDACRDAPDLRSQVEALLRASQQSVDAFRTKLSQGETILAQDDIAEGPGSAIGRYKLLQKIGEGGMGVVFMAEQTEPVRRKVALKIIKLGMDTKSVVARFEAERQALALMDHPNIAKVLDAGSTETGRPYFVMELVKGVPISTYCDKNQLATAERLKLFTQACQAIQHAHQKGIIHRDIKPSNVLVTLHDGKPVPKVIDFGIAKATNQRLTEKTLFTNFAQMIGTPAYMSPEQAEMSGLDVDTRTDVYSLGVLLYELLTGTTPFPEKELLSKGYGEMQRIIAEEEPERPSLRMSTLEGEQQSIVSKNRAGDVTQLTRQLRGDLDWVAMKALEKDRTRRYETASGLAEDIERHLADQPVAARPPSMLYQFQKAWHRNRVIVSAGLGMAASLVIGLSVSLWKTTEARAAKQEANINERRATDQTKIAVEEAGNARRAEAEAKRLSVESARQADYNRRLAYASDMNQAQRTIESGNIGQAMELLSRYRPRGEEEDIRGWEWRYLRQQCRSDAEQILGDLGDRIVSMKFSTSYDGRWLVAKGLSEQSDPRGAMTYFDLKSGRSTRPSWLEDGDRLISFSPTEPVAAIHRPHFGVRLINFKTNEELWHAKLSLQFDVEGKGFVTGEFSGNGAFFWHTTGMATLIWRVEGGAQVLDLPWTGLPRIALSPDGSRYAVHHWQKEGPNLRVVEVVTGREIFNRTFERGDSIGVLRFSSDGGTLFANRDQHGSEIALIDAQTGDELGRLRGHDSIVTDIREMPDGRTLVTAGADQTVRLWDWKKRLPLRIFRGHREAVRRVAVLPDGESLVSGGYDGQIMLWKTASLRKNPSEVQVRDWPLWATFPPALKAFPNPGIRKRRWSFAHDSNAIHAIRAGRLMRVTGPKFEEERVLLDFGEEFGSFAFAEDYRHAASIDSKGDVFLWDLAGDQPEGRRIASVADTRDLEHIEIPGVFVEQDRLLIAEQRDGVSALRILRISDSSQQGRISLTEGELILCASKDGRCLMTTKHLMRGLGRLINLDTLKHTPIDIHDINNSSTHSAALALSRDLCVVSVGSHVARLVNLSTGALAGELRGQFSGAKGVFFSPDERRLATTAAGTDALRLWDPDTHRSVLTLGATGLLKFRSQFSRDGNLIAAESTSGRIHVWRAPSWETIDAWDKEEVGALRNPSDSL